jgi:hypothetical protein
MDYETAVQQKMNRQKEEEKYFVPIKLDHPFEQSFIKQTIYEIHKVLFWSYQKQVGVKLIPSGLCAKCNRLAVEHD